jgi:threonine synthase
MAYQGLIQKYRDVLPQVSDKSIITLLEGRTPLIPAARLCAQLKLDAQVYFKFEGLNPTGSFKDRGMTMAVSKAVDDGAKAVICASTGNTSASAAAYAARAGIKCIVIIPDGKIALGKLSQAMMYGAKTLEIDGNFDDALNAVVHLSQNYPLTVVNSINPFRIEGQKTSSYEICEDLGQSPDYQFMPVGNAGNITAYHKGYKEIKAAKNFALPKMMGFQAAGSAPIVLNHIIEHPETVATAIRIGNPASWKTAVEARDESGGVIDLVSDEEILEAQRILSSTEGVFCEPASAASVAGLIKYVRQGYFENKRGAKIVCILTGNGLKDPDTAIKNASIKTHKVSAVISDIVKVIGV